MLTGMDVLKSLIVATKLLPDDSTKIKYIFKVAGDSDWSLEPSDFRYWIESVVLQTEHRSLVTFCANIQTLWTERSLGCTDKPKLIQGIVLCLAGHLRFGDKNSAETTATLAFFDQAIFYCRKLEITSAIGSAQNLLRIFGETASKDTFEQVVKKYPDLPERFVDALSEGVIKKIGPSLVLKTYLGVTGNKNVSQDRTKIIEKVKKTLRLICANRSTDMSDTLARRDASMAELSRLIGEEEAQKWFGEEFPDMVGS